MEYVWTILIELGILGLVAYGYYLYQKRKILRNDKIDIYQTLSEMLKDIDNKFINKEKNLNNETELKNFVVTLTAANEEQDFKGIVDLLRTPPTELPDIFTDSFPSIIDQVNFHIKKK